MEFTFWDEQWRQHTEQKGEQGGKKTSSTDTPQNDNPSQERQD